MRVSDFESPPIITEKQNVGITVVPKLNCEHHLIHLKIDQITIALTLPNASRLAFTIQQAIDEIDDEADKKVFV